MNLLFVCTHNRCRSILAEAVTNHLGGDKLHARSAGSSPVGEVHPLSLRFLHARGIPTTGLHSKGWDDIGDPVPDVVVTVCDRAAGEACPLWLGPTPKVHWGLADPSALEGTVEEQQAAFIHTIDIIELRVRELLKALESTTELEKLLARMHALADLEPETTGA